MTTNVRYVPGDRVIDLAKPLADDDYRLITGLHGAIKRGDRVLLCLREGVADPEMTVRRHPFRADRFVAAHFPGGSHEGGHPISPETPEHRRQKDYWARAAVDSGLSAVTELYVKGAGVLDVVITGGAVTTDVEVQHSAESESEIKRRTTRYRKAGYLPVWFNDAGARPLWLREVPAVGCGGVRWDKILPARRTVMAEGLGILREARCEVGAFGRSFEGRCPVTAGRPCGRIHPEVTAGKRMLIDDVASLVPASELIPLSYFDRNVFLASQADFTRYQEMTEGLGQWPPAAGKAPVRIPGGQRPQPCRNPGHNMPAGPQSLADELWPLDANAAALMAGESVQHRNPQATWDSDEADPHGLGTWRDCARCQRRYRPAHISACCYDCRQQLNGVIR